MNYLAQKYNVKQSITFVKSTLALAISMAFTYNAFASDEQNICKESCSKQVVSGKVTQASDVFTTKILSNSERLLANESFVFHGLNETPLTSKTVVQSETRALKINNLPHLNFVSGKHFITEQAKAQMNKLIHSLSDKKNLKLHFIGHADAQRLSARAKKIYQTNVGLSNYRASVIANYFQQQLGLAKEAITTEGKGSSLPIASNETLSGMAKNRRVELVIWYDEISEKEVRTEIPAFDRTEICHTQIQPQAPFSVTVDGQPLALSLSSNDADQQRCTDVALANADIQLQYDNLSAEPSLNISATRSDKTQDDANIINFLGYSNYQYYIDAAQVRLFRPGQSTQSEPIKVVNLTADLSGELLLDEALSAFENLHYRLRVYNAHGTFDETETKVLPITRDDASNNQAKLLSGYGTNKLAIQNIAVTGGSLTIHGHSIPEDHKVIYMGREIPVNNDNAFVAQQIIPTGQHKVEVAVLNEEGNGQLFQRHLSLKADDWFYVGMADLTLGKNKTSGTVDLLGESHIYQDDLFLDGRFSFYAKGKWLDKYTVTASIDTREENIEEIFSNLDAKDPHSLFRRLEEENHFAVYGDDSTLIEDAPTQGKFYARINDERSHLMWGNFATAIKDTELSRIERGLYGANLAWRSEQFTSFGERAGQVDIFAAEAGTKAVYEEHQGTGGSLYYLQNQDISRGSERLSIEVRDKDSGLVLSSTRLTPGIDYDIDALQGRVLLTKPLSSISQDGQIVRTSGLSGNNNFLVVNYEYTPGFDDIQDLAIGGRASYWLNDHIKLGITASQQEAGLEDNKLRGVDLTLRHSGQSYLRIEAAETEGNGLSANVSNNGGYHFTSTNLAQNAGEAANAVRVESAFAFKDFDLAETEQARGYFYWQHKEAGFSGLGQLTQFETEQAGVMLNIPVSEDSLAKIKIDSRDEVGGVDKLSGEISFVHQLTPSWAVSSGLRIEDSETNNETLNYNIGQRTDLAVQVDHQYSKDMAIHAFVQGTLDHDENKLANNRLGLGTAYQMTDNLTVNAEVSGGNQGFGAILGSNYQYDQSSNLYLNYELDPDRTDNGLAGRNGQFVTGVNHKFSDSVSVYGEERYQHGDNRVGLTHAYGIEYVPSEKWVLGASIESGEQEQPGQPALSRNAIALLASYTNEGFKYGAAVEYREDKTDIEERDSYLVRNNFAYKMNPDWRTQLRVDFAISDSSNGNSLNSDYTEALLGFAYRPITNDKLNALITYNYLYDLAPALQFTNTGQQYDYQQKSHVFAIDANYDLSQRWTIGGKFAHKFGEVRMGRDEGQWFDSTTNLYVLRADWHVVNNWDFLIEARMLENTTAKDKRSGFLTAIHRHLNEHFKIGIGYNFSDFSDDLTHLDYDAKGFFLNIVGKL